MNNRKYNAKDYCRVAIDYDATLTQGDSFPKLGELKPFAVETLNAMLKEGYELMIWTCRNTETYGIQILKQLSDAGVDVSTIKVNEHFDYYLNKYSERSAKIYCDVYIDDRAYGAPEIHWPDIYRSFIPQSLDKTI